MTFASLKGKKERTMPRWKCPLCRSQINVEQASTYSRVSCNKCHSDLYLGSEGKLVVGNPPILDNPIEELKQGLDRLVRQIPVGKIVTGFVVAFVLILGLYQVFGPAEQLEPVAEKAASLFASDDLKSLKSLAEPDTIDDLQRWYESVRPRLARLRNDWVMKNEESEAHIAIDKSDHHKGSAVFSIHPVSNGARDVSLADPASATASASVPFEVMTDWTLNKWGRWKLDGKATYARIAPTSGAP
jgi:hypothetical protein